MAIRCISWIQIFGDDFNKNTIFFQDLHQINFAFNKIRCHRGKCCTCSAILPVISYVLSATWRIMESLAQCCLDANGLNFQCYCWCQHVSQKALLEIRYNIFNFVKVMNENQCSALSDIPCIFDRIRGLWPWLSIGQLFVLKLVITSYWSSVHK